LNEVRMRPFRGHPALCGKTLNCSSSLLGCGSPSRFTRRQGFFIPNLGPLPSNVLQMCFKAVRPLDLRRRADRSARRVAPSLLRPEAHPKETCRQLFLYVAFEAAPRDKQSIRQLHHTVGERP